MIRKKVALIGAFGVGKTSLVRRFVSNEFSDEYLSTIGVRVEKRTVLLGTEAEEQSVELLIWDIAGEDEFSQLQASYLRGSSGVLLVGDSTRAWTLHKAQELRVAHSAMVPNACWHYLLNKTDMPADAGLQAAIESTGFVDAFATSAKTGDGVENVFADLAQSMIGPGVKA